MYTLPGAFHVFSLMALTPDVWPGPVDVQMGVDGLLSQVVIVEIRIRVTMTFWGQEDTGM